MQPVRIKAGGAAKIFQVMGRRGQRLSGSKWLPQHFESSGYNKESKYYPGEKLPVLFVQEKPLCSLVFSICQKEMFRQRFISVCERKFECEKCLR